MEFIFKPEKLTEDLSYEVSAAISKRAELASRKKFPALWEKTDALNAHKIPEETLQKRKFRRVLYGIFLIGAGIFLLIPGLMKPAELTVPLIVGAFSLINGIFAVLPRKTDEEKNKRKAKKLINAINSSLNHSDTVIFNGEAVFENGSLLMEYEDFEPPIECRNVWFFCDGTKILVLRKSDLVLGKAEDFTAFIEEKTTQKMSHCE